MKHERARDICAGGGLHGILPVKCQIVFQLESLIRYAASSIMPAVKASLPAQAQMA